MLLFRQSVFQHDVCKKLEACPYTSENLEILNFAQECESGSREIRNSTGIRRILADSLQGQPYRLLVRLTYDG